MPGQLLTLHPPSLGTLTILTLDEETESQLGLERCDKQFEDTEGTHEAFLGVGVACKLDP
jgi:hypothetical protein